MGNALFRCRTTSTNDDVRVKGRRRSFWEKILSSCGYKAPSEQRRSSIIENVSSNKQKPCSGWASENRCTPDRLDAAKEQSSVKHASRSRSTSKAFISLDQENPGESLLHTIKEPVGLVYSSTASKSVYFAISSNSPNTARKLFNEHCTRYQKLQVYSPSSHWTPASGDPPDMTRQYFNAHCYQKLETYSPPRLSRGSQNMTTLSFNEHCYEKHEGQSPISPPSPITSDSPDMTRTSFNHDFHPHQPITSDSPDTTRTSFNHDFHPHQHVSSPTSLSSPIISDSPDSTRMPIYQYSDYEQQHVDSPTSRSSRMSSSSVDMMRKSFNQHCNQQRPSPVPKKCQSPRRHNKPYSGKSSRRKRSGMRSSSYRTVSNSKSPGRAVEDNEDRINGMGSQSRKISDSKSPRMAFSGHIEDNKEKSCKLLRSLPQTSNSKSLGRAFKEDSNNEDNSNGLRSQFHRNRHAESPGKTVKWRIDDNELAGTPHPSFYEGRAAVVNVIPRSTALALIRRQKARRNVTHSSEYCRSHWKPALESISEAGDWKSF